MLNTQKLLYVLPDLAYIAELLPDKKPYSFAIQSFKQINGEFLNETEFIPENIVKLINKLDEGEEYFLILPDFLFTNTIVSVKETSETKIKEKLTSETLPGLNLKEDTHLTETVVLNELKGTTRVQISAIEKSVLSVFKVAVAEKEIKIAGIAPLSWAVKSLVSLEPSISVLQLGTNLYTAQHYIGVDQTTTAGIDQPDNIIETIKTLKGAEPSIQTVYVCTNAIVEEKLKDSLSKILPIQQMATKDPNEKIPSYVSQIIIASMRTMSIPDYSVPTFKLGRPSQEEKELYAAVLTAAGVETSDEEDDVSAELPKPQISPVPAEKEEKAIEEEPVVADEPEEKALDIETVTEDKPEELDLPEIETADTEKTDDQDRESDELGSVSSATAVSAGVASAAIAAAGISPASATSAVEVATLAASDTAVSDASDIEAPSNESKADIAVPNSDSTSKPSDTTTEQDSEKSEVLQKNEPSTDKPVKEEEVLESISAVPPVVVGASHIDSPPVTSTINSPVASTDGQDIDLKQFAQNGETAVESSTVAKPVIKNKSGAQHMMKMIFITTGVFILTVAIGIGVGLAILKYSGSQQGSGETPVVEVEQPTTTPTPTAPPTPSASPSAAIDKSAVKILVVNATTKAGYAGQIQTKLEGADFEEVSTGNAKGDYDDEGNFVYMKEENQALLTAMEEATALKLTATDSAQVEDTQGTYDAVLVLAE